MREINENISAHLRGKFGPDARRWLGMDAGYVAKHLWMVKHFGKATYCSFDPNHKAKRYEWANISGKYERDPRDYMQMCPSCHRLFDLRGRCRSGHLYTPGNTKVNNRGHRVCLTCLAKRN